MVILALGNLCGAIGGIPAFNQLLVRAAGEWAAERGERLFVVALADPPGGRPDAAMCPALAADAYAPCGGARGRFARSVLSLARRGRAEGAGRRRPLLVLGHAYFGPLGICAAALGARYGVIAHGLEVWRPLSAVRRLALRRAAWVGCVSEYTRGFALRQGARVGRCARLINALDPRWFDEERIRRWAEADAEKERDKTRGGAIELLTITRLHPGEPKGIDHVLRALPELPQVRFVIAGEGGDRPRLEALARELRLGERARFVGEVDAARRAELLAACDVFTMPSLSEGFGIVYLEAMAYGRPCVAARAGGVPEVIVDGETGLLGPQRPSFLVEAIGELARDPALRARMGEAGRRRVLENFLYPHFRAHVHRYLDLLRGNSPGPTATPAPPTAAASSPRTC